MCLNKILAAFYPTRVGGRRFFIQQALDYDFLCEADEVYEDFYHDNRFKLLTRAQIKSQLVVRGIIQPNVDKQVERAYKLVSNEQEKLFLNRDNPKKTKSSRRQIKAIRDSIEDLLGTMYQYYRYSLEDSAHMAKRVFILENTVYDKDMNPVSFKDIGSIDNFSISISSTDIRKIAREEPWRTMWAVKKGAAFQYLPLTDMQIMLSSFSRMYENVYKTIDSSLLHIVDDDDMLDGWQIVESKSRKKGEEPKKTAAHKHNNVFEFVETKEELDAVHNSNSALASQVIAARNKQIEKAGGKAVEYNSFGDVRMSNATRRPHR